MKILILLTALAIAGCAQNGQHDAHVQTWKQHKMMEAINE